MLTNVLSEAAPEGLRHARAVDDSQRRRVSLGPCRWAAPRPKVRARFTDETGRDCLVSGLLD